MVFTFNFSVTALQTGDGNCTTTLVSLIFIIIFIVVSIGGSLTPQCITQGKTTQEVEKPVRSGVGETQLCLPFIEDPLAVFSIY